MNEEYISIGRILRVHGTEGWVRVEMYSEIPNRLEGIRVVFLEAPGEPEGKIIKEIQYDNRGVLLRFKDVTTREEAKQIVGREILLPESQKVKLPRDTYFVHDLLNMDVVDEQGQPLGRIAEVLHMSGNDVYVVRNGEREVLIPAVGEFVRQVDVKKRKMVVRLWEDM